MGDAKDQLMQMLVKVDKGQQQKILQKIQNIKFPNLLELSLYGNSISSVQELSRMHIPQIRDIDLASNNIRSVSVLRKAPWHSLQHLYTGINYICNSKTLTQGNFPRLKLWSVFFQLKEYDKMVDPTFPSKLPTKSLSFLGIEEQKFMLRRSIKKALQRKWLSPNLFGDI